MKCAVLLALFCAFTICSATFSWSNCGSSSDPIHLQALSITPDPIVLGQNITISFTASSTINVTSKHSAQVKMWKKVAGFWTTIPCLDNVGSCTYDDFCSLFPVHPCGPVLNEHHVPCHCPFNEGKYSIPPSSVKTKNPGWSFLTDGDFSVQGQLNDDNGNRLACYLVYFSLAEGKIVP